MTSRGKNGERKIAGGRKLRTKGGSPKDGIQDAAAKGWAPNGTADGDLVNGEG